MSEALEKLKAKPKRDTDLKPGQRGFKKAYFLERVDLILELVDDYGYSYKEIIEAIKKDGVELNYVVFRRWMAEEKERRKLEQPATVSAQPVKPASPVKPDVKQPAQPRKAKTSVPDMTPEKAAYIAECEAIQNDKTINSKQRRELLVQAEERYSKTHTLRG